MTDKNENLQQQAFALFDQLMLESGDSKCLVSDVAYLNPKRQLSKNQVARCIDMSQLSTSGAFPSGWDMKPFNGGMRFINGDTLLARITPCLENGKTAYIDFLDKKEVAFGSTEYIVLAPREGVPPEYLYCLARYGYIKDPKDKHQLIVDPEAAETVKKIYEMCLQGTAKLQIVMYLNDHGIPSPTAYRKLKGLLHLQETLPDSLLHALYQTQPFRGRRSVRYPVSSEHRRFLLGNSSPYQCGPAEKKSIPPP